LAEPRDPNTRILNASNMGLNFNHGLINGSKGERNIQFAMKFYH